MTFTIGRKKLVAGWLSNYGLALLGVAVVQVFVKPDLEAWKTLTAIGMGVFLLAWAWYVTPPEE